MSAEVDANEGSGLDVGGVALAATMVAPPARAHATAWFRGDHPVYAALKRALDLILSSILLVPALPVLAIAVLAIRLETPGPAIFKQTRIGRHGRPFTFYKLRGMFVDARQRFPELYDYTYSPGELSSLRFHPDRDPRVTRVGRFLRRTSIDELPNLFNVLLGQMSLVGPRPEIPELIQYYGDDQKVVLSVKPGVTSSAKTSGRDELTFSETLAMDVDYVHNRSLGLDLRVIFHTAVTVIRQDGIR